MPSFSELKQCRDISSQLELAIEVGGGRKTTCHCSSWWRIIVSQRLLYDPVEDTYPTTPSYGSNVCSGSGACLSGNDCSGTDSLQDGLLYQDFIQGLNPLITSFVGFQTLCKFLHDVGDDVMSTAGNRVACRWNPTCNSSPILPRLIRSLRENHSASEQYCTGRFVHLRFQGHIASVARA